MTSLLIKLPRLFFAGALIANMFSGSVPAWAEMISSAAMALPVPGQIVSLSAISESPRIEGVRVYAKDPFRFDFIVNSGDDGTDVRQESERLIRYFMAALTVPDKDLWVNLSPYEANRIIPDQLGKTELGRDFLSEDYILKQVSSSLLHPDGATGQLFWQKIYAEVAKIKGLDAAAIPVDALNKVWIMPSKAVVYEDPKTATAYVLEARLKVMLESDHQPIGEDIRDVSGNESMKQVMRSVIIPVLEQEVNEGAQFSRLRQAYHSLILAAWYKRKIKESLLAGSYVDRSKVLGIETGEPSADKRIYERYLKAFQQGVFNFIREEQSLNGEESLPRKYFSGGMDMAMTTVLQLTAGSDATMATAWRTKFSSERNVRRVVVMAGIDPAQVPKNMKEKVVRVDQAMAKNPMPNDFYSQANRISIRNMTPEAAGSALIEDGQDLVRTWGLNGTDNVNVVAIYGQTLYKDPQQTLKGTAVYRKGNSYNDGRALLMLFRAVKSDANSDEFMKRNAPLYYSEILLARVLDDLLIAQPKIKGNQYLLAVSPDSEEAEQLFQKAGFVELKKPYEIGADERPYYVITAQKARAFRSVVMHSVWYDDQAQMNSTGGIDMRAEQMGLDVRAPVGAINVDLPSQIDQAFYANVPGFSVRIIDVQPVSSVSGWF